MKVFVATHQMLVRVVPRLVASGVHGRDVRPSYLNVAVGSSDF